MCMRHMRARHARSTMDTLTSIHINTHMHVSYSLMDHHRMVKVGVVRTCQLGRVGVGRREGRLRRRRRRRGEAKGCMGTDITSWTRMSTHIKNQQQCYNHADEHQQHSKADRVSMNHQKQAYIIAQLKTSVPYRWFIFICWCRGSIISTWWWWYRAIYMYRFRQ